MILVAGGTGTPRGDERQHRDPGDRQRGHDRADDQPAPRSPQWRDGQVRFGGTRIPVSVVLDCLASGMSEAEILNEYPTLPARAAVLLPAIEARLVADEAA